VHLDLGRARELTSVVQDTAPGADGRPGLVILIIRQLLLKQGLKGVGMARAR
jgi:hypothetical protein